MGGESQKYEHETIKTAFASAAMCHSLPKNATRHHYVQGAIVSVEFAEIDSFVPIKEVISCYSPYHEMDISRFCEHLDDLYRVAHPESRLKEARERRGMTQEALSTASGVPLRMIQHYEQRSKNLAKAAFDTVFRLAQALHVLPQNIVEP